MSDFFRRAVQTVRRFYEAILQFKRFDLLLRARSGYAEA